MNKFIKLKSGECVDLERIVSISSIYRDGIWDYFDIYCNHENFSIKIQGVPGMKYLSESRYDLINKLATHKRRTLAKRKKIK